ncbi:MAG: leucyl aminopeptidase family protein [Planctomycetes bacterium]|nr:leucyl aminopeptidase family protein [Planctomycetota bacterium]
MPVPTFKIATSYTPKTGDFICLPYASQTKPAYAKEIGPKTKMTIPVPKKKGGSQIIWVGKAGDKATHHVTKAYRIDAEHETAEQCVKNMVSDALKCAKQHECKQVLVLLDAKTPELVIAAQEGALLGGYVFDKYFEKKKSALPVTVVIQGPVSAKLKKSLAEGKVVADYTNQVRDILNTAPNERNPLTVAKDYQRIGKSAGLKVTVWDEKRLKKERCGGILGVGMGSAFKPRLVIAEYSPRGAKKHLCLVGKGVSFDTGGYCLKPSTSQIGMELDMGGSAMMFGAACAIAKLKLPVKVTLLTPLVENRISADSYLTTSVLTFRNGKSTSVENTDAEGRLILADALCLAAEKKPDYIIDAATLTGACVVGLGEDIAGAFGTDAKFTQNFLCAAANAGEYFWELPLHMPYAEMLKTHRADSKNIGGRWGGSITAALFLKQFVPDKQKWIHCDIAGPAGKEAPLQHLGKGAKGFGVKTVVELARDLK